MNDFDVYLVVFQQSMQLKAAFACLISTLNVFCLCVQPTVYAVNTNRW